MIDGGADVFFYNYSVGARTGALLERYARGELAMAHAQTPAGANAAIEQQRRRAFGVSIVQWRVPVRVHVWPRPAGYLEEVHYFAQMAMLNECLLRALRRFEYIVFTDIDEVRVEQNRRVSLRRPSGIALSVNCMFSGYRNSEYIHGLLADA